MSKIILDDNVTNINNALLPYNENFRKIEEEFQNKVLYRDNPSGEPNEMSNPIDMDNNRIYNLPQPEANHEAARLEDVKNAIAGNEAYLINFEPYEEIVATDVQTAIEETKDFIDEAIIDSDGKLEEFKTDLVSSAGSELVGYDGGTVSEALDTIKTTHSSELVYGLSRKATQPEVTTGISDEGFITPLKLQNKFADFITRSEFEALDDELDFTIIYPNGGSEGSPANITYATQYVETNPFPNHYVLCEVEILYLGIWVTPGWYSNNTNAIGVRVGMRGNSIVVTTGRGGVLTSYPDSGSSSTYPTAVGLETLPGRVKVRKLKGQII